MTIYGVHGPSSSCIKGLEKIPVSVTFIMGRSKQPHTAMSEPAMTPPVSPTPSCQGSILSCMALLMFSSISQGVSSLKSAVKNGIKKGAKAIRHPFKKTHGMSMVDNSSKDSDKVGSSH
jgi:hypothetical protein